MQEQLYRAIVTCFPPAGRDGRFRAGRHFAAGVNVVEDLSEKDIAALKGDVMLDSVNRLDKTTKVIRQEQVKKAFFSVTEIQPSGTREIPDLKPAELPADRLPTAPELISLLHDMSKRQMALEEQNLRLQKKLDEFLAPRTLEASPIIAETPAEAIPASPKPVVASASKQAK